MALLVNQILSCRKKRQWMPPNWSHLLAEMKVNGTDGASLDKALGEISRNRDRGAACKGKTGKYLMPEDLAWCRKNSRFSERELVRYGSI